MIRILLFSIIIVFTIRQIKKIFADATAAPQEVSADAAVVDVDVIVDEPGDHHIKGRWTEDQSVKASRVPSLLSMKHNTHVEFDHGVDIYGWDHLQGKSDQIDKAKDFFKTLTHQEKYYFTHSNHGYYENFIHYSQCHNIIIDKCDQLLKIRDMTENKKQWSVNTNRYVPLMKNTYYFNIDTFLDPTEFKNEMKQLFEYLKINFDRYDLTETLRQDFHNQQVVKVKGTSRAKWFRERYESRQNQ